MIHGMIDCVAIAVFISSLPKCVPDAARIRQCAHFIQELAGLGGDTSFAKAEAESHITRRVFRGLVSLRNTSFVALMLIHPLARFLCCNCRAAVSTRRQNTTI